MDNNIIEVKSEFIPIPVSLLYAKIMMLMFIGTIREKGQSARQAEVEVSEYMSAIQEMGLPLPSGKKNEVGERLKAEIETSLNIAYFTFDDGRTFKIKLFDGIICSEKGNECTLKAVFSDNSREYIFNNRDICDDKYDVMPTIVMNNNEMGTVLTARIPQNMVELIVSK